MIYSERPVQIGIVILAAMAVILSAPAYGDVSQDIKGAIEKKVQQAQEAAGKPAEKKPSPAGPASAGIVFSGSPIDPAKPASLSTAFKAGGYIYGLISVDKPWRELLGKGNPNATEVQVPVDMLVDGEQVDFQYITLKKPEPIDSKHLVLDIAPEPEKMTAYKDPAFFYAEGKGNRKIGPDQYTYNLAALQPGKHTIGYRVRSYGDVLASGEFTIEGEDYKSYAALREKLLGEALGVATMPKAQMTNIELQANMMKLLQNAGWKNIRKLVISDKDWWLDRAEGGDSPIVARHIAAAVAAKADDGSFYWCICTFQQPKLLDGSFGTLELSHTGEKKPILEENIDK
jgi:hypothetical protein